MTDSVADSTAGQVGGPVIGPTTEPAADGFSAADRHRRKPARRVEPALGLGVQVEVGVGVKGERGV